jgi:acylaminoacyl-peptidase
MRPLTRLLTGLSAAALLGSAALPALAESPPAVAAGAPAAAATEINAFTWEDMIALNRLGDPQVSPDGRWVVYSVTTTDVAANRRSGALYMMDLSAPGEPVRLAINEGGANTGRWGSDGNLYFLSGRSGSSQVWRAAADGTGPVQVTDLPLDVNAYRLSPDASKVAVSLAVFPDCPDLACTVDRAKAIADDPATGRTAPRTICSWSMPTARARR